MKADTTAAARLLWPGRLTERAVLPWVCVTALAVVIGLAAARTPAETIGLPGGVIVPLLLGVWLKRRVEARDGVGWAEFMLVALGFHLLLTLVHLLVGYGFYGGAVDFPYYNYWGTEIGSGLLRGRLVIIEAVSGITSDLSSLVNVVGYLNLYFGLYLSVLLFFIVGPSLVGMFLLSGVMGFVGTYLFFRAFQVAVPGGDRRFLAALLFFLPTIAFWSVLLGKESWIVLFLGAATYHFARLAERFQIWRLAVLGSLLALAVLLRPAVGLVVTVVAVPCLVARVGRGTLVRPALLLGSAGAAVALLNFVGESVGIRADNAVDLLVHKHSVLSADYLTLEEGLASASSLPAVVHTGSPAELLAYLPVGIFTYLFRPLPFEAHNVLALAASLDSVLLLVLVALRWRNLAAAVRGALTSPFLAFCVLVFLALVSVLSFQRNFGLIVRTRVMVLPFLAVLMAVPAATPRTKRGEP